MDGSVKPGLAQLMKRLILDKYVELTKLGLPVKGSLWLCFVSHYPTCFYLCPKPDCNFHIKRKDRFAGHMRKHDMDM